MQFIKLSNTIKIRKSSESFIVLNISITILYIFSIILLSKICFFPRLNNTKKLSLSRKELLIFFSKILFLLFLINGWMILITEIIFSFISFFSLGVNGSFLIFLKISFILTLIKFILSLESIKLIISFDKSYFESKKLFKFSFNSLLNATSIFDLFPLFTIFSLITLSYIYLGATFGIL